jgi:hypothetical protein
MSVNRKEIFFLLQTKELGTSCMETTDYNQTAPVFLRNTGAVCIARTLHYSAEISNRQFILDFAKVLDFIDDIDTL